MHLKKEVEIADQIKPCAYSLTRSEMRKPSRAPMPLVTGDILSYTSTTEVVSALEKSAHTVSTRRASIAYLTRSGHITLLPIACRCNPTGKRLLEPRGSIRLHAPGINHYSGNCSYDVSGFIEKDCGLLDSASVSLFEAIV
jgi:hypothetical protein